MFKNTILYCTILVLSVGCLSARGKEIPLTFEQAMHLMQGDNKNIRIAEYETELAKSEHHRVHSFWLPRITATGAYVHLSNNIEVKESLSQFTGPAVDFIHSIFPEEELISSLLNEVGKNSFSVPLLPRDMTTIDALVTFPVFTGGKRIYAGKIGKLMVNAAEINKENIDSQQQILLVQTYYGLRLGREVVKVRKETYDAMEIHYQNALKLEANGMLNKAERLFFQVNRDEAKRELEMAVKELDVLENAFRTLVKINSDGTVLPVSSLFINENLPEVIYFKELVLQNNYLLNGIDIQDDIQKNQLKIAQSAYLPDIELFGKQTLYANGIPKNFSPRTMVGIGFIWNIFDGLDREKRIRQAKINSHILTTEKKKVKDDILLAVDRFYNQTQTALDNVEALKTTIEMSRELVRSRRKAYSEGMATSAEVIDAELMLSKMRLATLLAYFQFDTGLINLLSVSGVPDTFYQYSLNGKDERYVFSK